MRQFGNNVLSLISKYDCNNRGFFSLKVQFGRSRSSVVIYFINLLFRNYYFK